jgi:hypothetical protein
MHACDWTQWVFGPLPLLLRHPALLGELLVLVAILVFAAGRAFGIPLLFWHEDPGPQFLAGLATTLAVAQAMLTAVLSDPDGGDPVPGLVWGGVVWSVIVAVAVVTRVLARKSPHRESLWLRGLTAPIQRIDARAPAEDQLCDDTASQQVAPWPFLGGFFAASLAIALVAWAVARFGPEWEKRVRPVAEAAVEVVAPFHGGRVARAREHFAAHAPFHVLALVSLLPVAAAFAFRRRATPAIAICTVLSFVAAVDGLVTFWIGSSGVLLLILGVLLFRAGGELFAIRIDELRPLYEDPRHYPPTEASRKTIGPLLADQLASPKELTRSWPSARDDGTDDPRPLVLVCVSGGGIRAACWTAGILAKLEARMPAFPRETLMVTGASGGMVGAAAWVSNVALREEGAASADTRDGLVKAIGIDGLTAIARALAFDDIPKSFLRAENRTNRGAALQGVWTGLRSKTAGVDFGRPLAQLGAGEAQGRWPSLVFSPMIVEDGRRLLVSNLKLPWVTQAKAPWVGRRGGETIRSLASVSAFHAEDLFGVEGMKAISLGTAARLSAAFPYVCPATVLPTKPRRRVVDAGYYDNFGVDLATHWLERALAFHGDWLKRRVSRVLVIQIRDGLRTTNKNPAAANAPSGVPNAPAGLMSPLLRGLEGVTSPIAGLLSAREAVMDFRNDAQLDAVSQAYARSDIPIATTVFELKASLSLSWRLARVELDTLRAQLESAPIARKVDDVHRYLRARAGWTPSNGGDSVYRELNLPAMSRG